MQLKLQMIFFQLIWKSTVISISSFKPVMIIPVLFISTENVTLQKNPRPEAMDKLVIYMESEETFFQAILDQKKDGTYATFPFILYTAGNILKSTGSYYCVC